MQEHLCIDANILVKFFSRDENSDFATRLLDNIQESNSRIYVPALSHFEFANALCKKQGRAILTSSEVHKALDHLNRIPIILYWKIDLILEAHDLCSQGLPSFYDATYVATAKLNGVPLLTQDKELKKKGRRLYPNIFTLEEWLGPTR